MPLYTDLSVSGLCHSISFRVKLVRLLHTVITKSTICEFKEERRVRMPHLQFMADFTAYASLSMFLIVSWSLRLLLAQF